MYTAHKATAWPEPDFAELVPVVQQRLFEFGTPLLFTETESRLSLAERRLRAFEQKYGTTLAQLRRDGLPNDASMEMHEDYVEWSGWQRTCEEASHLLSALRPFLERSYAFAVAG